MTKKMTVAQGIEKVRENPLLAKWLAILTIGMVLRFILFITIFSGAILATLRIFKLVLG